MSSCFRLICLLHSCIDVVSGSLIMFFLSEMATVGLGKETASKLLGSTPHDQLLIKTSEALVGICYVIIGFSLRGGLRILHGTGQGKWWGTSCWQCHGCSFWCGVGEKNMIDNVEEAGLVSVKLPLGSYLLCLFEPKVGHILELTNGLCC